MGPMIKNGAKPITDSTNDNHGFFKRATSPESCELHDTSHDSTHNTSHDDFTNLNGHLLPNGTAKDPLIHKTANINKKKRCLYGTRKFKYLGTNSEGNRFITNQDL